MNSETVTIQQQAVVVRDDVSEPSYWSGVVAMSLCVFALVASEFMPVSLLTPIAQDLHVTQGEAGQGIAISGLFAVFTSLSIAAIAGAKDRKLLLLAFTALMAFSGVLVAFAANYPVYMIGRMMIGVVIGGFWSMSAAVAIRLVPLAQVPKALAIFNAGNALAVVVAAPLGSYLGSIIGWRGAFLCLVPVVVIVLAWQWISLPSMKAIPHNRSSNNVLKLLKTRTIALGMAGCGLFFMGQFSLYTYVRPFLETETHASVSTISLILLTIGVMGLIGTALIGRFLKKHLYQSLIVIPMVMLVITICLVFFGAHVVVVTASLGVWGLVATAAPVGWWTWIAKVMPENAELGGGLMVAIVQMSIALGSTVGGLLFDAGGHRLTFFASAAMLLLSAALTYFTLRAADKTR
ncbi:MFS transporter [Rheinheimera mangrovi]|uniref:MFS transporter n=1 Tax=Rheinheimera mangrovi TaxID=2498451 RepID=UPI000F8E5F0C|nr:MFS transporter [Rheinheimera mangrovi]